MDALITPIEADALISTSLGVPGHETVPLTETLGRTLYGPIVADRDLPPYSRAMMDGIALDLSAADLSTPLELAGLHAAGEPPPRPLKPGEAWEIMTGAMVPEDCDTVIPYEHLSSDHRSVIEPATAGQFIHRAASDAQAGDTLVHDVRLIGPAEIAIAASVGLTELNVGIRPKVALISSGDEAVPISTRPEPWQIRRSNGAMLEAWLNRGGNDPVMHAHIPDDPASCSKTLKQAIDQADLILVCGGISKGKRDFIRPVLEEILGPPAFHGVAQRPGKPLAFWSGPPAVFALPGNPVSVLATFARYVIPSLAQLEGRDPSERHLACPPSIEALPRLTWLLPLGADGTPLPPKNSGDFISIAGVDGFLEIPPAPEFDAGQALRHYPLHIS
ncbi:molybdenum cofactor biosynthesis protein [Haloferula helveola]|uniref:Molybdopterin molybdenumtransferase n=1 Tax=Haloferula helveola TaxID=490095 RepID=A0ABM7RNQ4_9BACT|nr:molybdenum cofactor biosynthesis protein [Haloferula helveola]